MLILLYYTFDCINSQKIVMISGRKFIIIAYHMNVLCTTYDILFMMISKWLSSINDDKFLLTFKGKKAQFTIQL